MQNLITDRINGVSIWGKALTCLISSGYRVILCTVKGGSMKEGVTELGVFTWNEKITRKIEVSDSRVFSKVL